MARGKQHRQHRTGKAITSQPASPVDALDRLLAIADKARDPSAALAAFQCAVDACREIVATPTIERRVRRMVSAPDGGPYLQALFGGCPGESPRLAAVLTPWKTAR